MTEPQARDLRPARDGKDVTPVGRYLVAVIGINQYVHLPALSNAVSDATGIRRLFTEKLGFTVAAELFDADATKDAIWSLVDETLRQALRPDDALLLFFAGHGDTRVDKIGAREVETGFLVPVNAHREHWSELVEIDSFLQTVAKLPARHALVILDACKSGVALGDVMQKYRGLAEYERDVAGRLSRKVMTSARRDQLALDSGPVAGHSLFTGTLIDGLNWGKADLDGNGIVTGSELGLYIQQQVGQFSGSKQTPDFGEFLFDDRGELVISLRDDSFDAVKARAFAALQRGEMDAFRALADQAVAVRPESAEARYLSYRCAMHEHDIKRALEQVWALESVSLNEGVIPLSRHDLDVLGIQLPYWDRLLQMHDAVFWPVIEVLAGPSQDRLEPVQFEVVDRRPGYHIPQGWAYRFRVTNPSDKPVYVYLMRIDTDGRLRYPPLWAQTALMVQGIAPGSMAESYPFATGAPGINELRFYAAPSMIPQLLAPPEVATRALLGPFDETAGIVQRTLLHVVLPAAIPGTHHGAV